jgi:hypothetical protein
VRQWLLLFKFILFILLCSSALAQGVSARRVAGALYISVSDVAARLGYSVSESVGSFTVRFDTTVLTLFADSPDITVNGAEDTLSSSVFQDNPISENKKEWFAPEDSLSFLKVTLTGTTLTFPDGQMATLEFPASPTMFSSSRSLLVDLGNSVTGLTFYAAGSAGEETVSVLLLDLGLMALAFPEQQKSLDAVSSKFSTGKPIYFIVTALAPSPWQSSFTIEQQGRVLQYQAGSSLSILEGDASTVTPEAPVSGVLVLPDWVNLRQPVTVTWSGITASVQFRR